MSISQKQATLGSQTPLASSSSALQNSKATPATASSHTFPERVRTFSAKESLKTIRSLEHLDSLESLDSAGALATDSHSLQPLASKGLPIAYVLGLLAQLQSLPFHVFDISGNYLEKFNKEQEDNWNVLHTDVNLRQTLIQELLEKRVCLFNQEYPVMFGGVALQDNLMLIVGPTLIRQVDSNFVKLYAAKHHALNVVLQVTTPAKMSSILLLIHSSLTGEKISLTNFLDRYLFNNQEMLQKTSENIVEVYYGDTAHSRPHNPISFEHDIIKAIQHGDVDGLDRALNSPYAAMRGVLAKDPLRSQKNLSIVDVTLASRSLTDIGFPSEEIFIVSDAVIRNIENCKDIEEAKALARAYAVQCAMQVKNRHQDLSVVNSSYLVQQACEYMDRHVYNKFDVKVLADSLKVSTGYLSKLFKQERHMTMGEYMRRKKVSIAAILLANTDQSLDDIASSLAFCSQSHFGKVFVQEMGCAPAVYRKQSRKPKRPNRSLEQEGLEEGKLKTVKAENFHLDFEQGFESFEASGSLHDWDSDMAQVLPRANPKAKSKLPPSEQD